MKRHNLLHPALLLGTLLLDQITKLAVVKALPLYGSVPVIPGFFDLVHVRNKGMAFGLMNRPEGGFFLFVLIVASVAAIAALAYWYIYRSEDTTLSVSLGLCLMIGGAAGHLVDRVRLGEVIDFIDLYLGAYHWPAFNVADSAVSVGAIFLAIGVLRTGKP